MGSPKKQWRPRAHLITATFLGDAVKQGNLFADAPRFKMNFPKGPPVWAVSFRGCPENPSGPIPCLKESELWAPVL